MTSTVRASKPICSRSLDLDNQWSDLKSHGDAAWESFSSYLDQVVPRALAVLAERQLKISGRNWQEIEQAEAAIRSATGCQPARSQGR